MLFDRSEGNQRRLDRLKQVKKGAGVFVYDGEQMDSESTPTPLLSDGASEPVFDAHGNVALDAGGRQIFQRRGTPIRDEKGNIVLGGVPKVRQFPIEVFEIQGVKFPAGVPVKAHATLALKLRGMAHFEEVEEVEPEAKGPARHELMALARERGIAYTRDVTRAELIALLGDEVSNG